MTRLAVVGDCLLDRDLIGRAERLCPDSTGPVVDVERELMRPGGAGLAALAARTSGVDVTLFTALSADESGTWLRTALEQAGIDVVDLRLRALTPQKIRIRTGTTTVARVDRDCSRIGDIASASAIRDALEGFDAVLASDYGRGLVDMPAVRCELEAVAVTTPVVWDPHPRGRAPVAGVRLATPSISDLPADVRATSHIDRGADQIEHLARRAWHRWKCAIALTCGVKGALLYDGIATLVSGIAAEGDPNGAGDCFAAEATVALAQDVGLEDVVRRAVAAGARHVRGEVTTQPLESVLDAADRGKRLVATSGCFDILHAGHLAMLRFARSLGDELVVCLNSDRSVRGLLKGDRRPLTPQAERIELLRALSLVDHVIVFDEPTPCEALRRFRPAFFVKGGDYADRTLPEHEVMAEWGGEVVFGPLVPERSTTRLIDVARLDQARTDNARNDMARLDAG